MESSYGSKHIIMMRFKQIFGSVLLILTGPLLYILLFIVHWWTVVIAYSKTGILGAIVTFCLPELAELYWFIMIWKTTGTLLNLYCLVVLASFVAIGLAVIASKLNDAD
jgi:hypothetical protein